MLSLLPDESAACSDKSGYAETEPRQLGRIGSCPRNATHAHTLPLGEKKNWPIHLRSVLEWVV